MGSEMCIRDSMDGVARDLKVASPGSLVAIEGMEIDLLNGTVKTP